MKVITLIENQGPPELEREHGLSFYIEYGTKKYLLDSGSTADFMKNAASLGVDLTEVDAAVLSHAHYDHAGGFAEFLKYNQKAKLYIRKGAAENCWKMSGEKEKYIGIPEGFLGEWQDRIVYVQGDYCLEDGVWLIPHKRDGGVKRGQRAGMFLKTSEGRQPDTFLHEQSLVFRMPKGLILFNSCSHSGIDDIVGEIKDTFPGESVYAVFGGFHLMKGNPDHLAGTEEEVQELGRKLLEEDVRHIYTGHCTGTRAFEILRETTNGRAGYCSTGSAVTFT